MTHAARLARLHTADGVVQALKSDLFFWLAQRDRARVQDIKRRLRLAEGIRAELAAAMPVEACRSEAKRPSWI